MLTKDFGNHVLRQRRHQDKAICTPRLLLHKAVHFCKRVRFQKSTVDGTPILEPYLRLLVVCCDRRPGMLAIRPEFDSSENCRHSESRPFGAQHCFSELWLQLREHSRTSGQFSKRRSLLLLDAHSCLTSEAVLLDLTSNSFARCDLFLLFSTSLLDLT